MSVAYYQLSNYIEIIIVFLFLMIIGIPVWLFVLWLLDKYYERVKLPKKKRVRIAVIANLILSILVGIYLYIEPYREDWAFDMATKESNISLPFYFVTSIEYPEGDNDGDDFCVNKTLKFLYSPSQKDIEQLERLCINDERWTKEYKCYHYQDTIFDDELMLDVIIDIDNNKAKTRYLKW